MSQYAHLLSESGSKGHYISQLTSDELKDLDRFVDALKSYRTTRGTLMSDGSRGSYRSYMAEVMVLAARGETLEGRKNSASLMSALRLFEKLMS